MNTRPQHSPATPERDAPGQSVGERRGERGAGLVSFLIISAVFWTTIFMSVQVAVWGFAHHVASSAAREAAQRVATQNGTAGDGDAFANQFVTSAAGNWIQGLNVTSSRSATEATVRITGTGIELIPVPFWDLRIDVVATDPVERFVPANE